MNDFAGMEELLQDFLQESSDLLSDVDGKLLVLEKSPDDHGLLNDIFRGFHTIKGGAGFLNASQLVTLCHLTENLFDKLRNGELALDSAIMDVILAATSEVRQMFNDLENGVQPRAAPAELTAGLQMALEGKPTGGLQAATRGETSAMPMSGVPEQPAAHAGPDWDELYHALLGGRQTVVAAPANIGAEITQDRRKPTAPGSNAPAGGRRDTDVAPKENTIRVDTERLDQVLNLSGEIGLTKNRLTRLRSDILRGNVQANTLRALDEAANQLDMLVVNLQNSVMKTRMQPIGRLFKKFPRLARDLARQLGKDIELDVQGEETEIDKTMIDDLNDPLVHLIRNAVDHGVESPEQRLEVGKPPQSIVRLSARQEGDHIVISIADDGKGMRPGLIRNKAIEKGLISSELANTLDDAQCLDLIFLPGFSTKEEISSVSGRGVGMDVVKTNIQKLNGRISIVSEPGKGTEFILELPLTLAILPVLLLWLGGQSFAVPLSMVREILPIEPDSLQQVGGKRTMVVRGHVLPVVSLASLIGWPERESSSVGVLMYVNKQNFILTADGFDGHDDVVIKSLDTFRPKGVAGVTMSSEGEIVLILDLNELLETVPA
jgi:two-component system chemotaxis sensor kinase CheA